MAVQDIWLFTGEATLEDVRLREEGAIGPPAVVTQYLPGHDYPEFPHEMDLISDKLPCPPPYD